jgi:2-dehydropantoate 2-reductase
VTFNKIFILGAGAIGSVIGAQLSKKNDVTLIGNKAHVDAVKSKGLLVSSSANETFHLGADTQIRKIPEKTLIFLTTKAYDSEKAVEGISRLLRKDTAILVLQNGLENEEIIKRAVHYKVEVLRGITNMAAEFFEAGEVKYWTGETVIERDGAAEEIAAIMNTSGLKASVSNNIKNETWSKVVLNSVINPLTAIFGVKNYEIFAQPLAEVRNQIIREGVQVGNAEGVTFPKDLEKGIDKEIMSYTNYSSMCQDIMRGKKTEIDFLNGKIVELGARSHIPTPVNETLVHLIKFLEEKHELPRKN